MTRKLVGGAPAGPCWRRDGADWVLFHGRRRVGRVVPDAKWPGMWRSTMSGGLSDMAGITWAKSAVLDAAVRELEWSAHHRPAIDPSKPQQKGGVFEGAASPTRQKGAGRQVPRV